MSSVFGNGGVDRSCNRFNRRLDRARSQKSNNRKICE